MRLASHSIPITRDLIWLKLARTEDSFGGCRFNGPIKWKEMGLNGALLGHLMGGGVNFNFYVYIMSKSN